MPSFLPISTWSFDITTSQHLVPRASLTASSLHRFFSAQRPASRFLIGGEGGIRTHGPRKVTRSPGVPDRPLQHLSAQVPRPGLQDSTSELDAETRKSRLRSCRWRRGRDSNPRSRCQDTAFRERHHKPLGHLSAGAPNGKLDYSTGAGRPRKAAEAFRERAWAWRRRGARRG